MQMRWRRVTMPVLVAWKTMKSSPDKALPDVLHDKEGAHGVLHVLDLEVADAQPLTVPLEVESAFDPPGWRDLSVELLQ
eukprot:8544697-Alexandrium_andersonii.AAC.1